MKPRQTPTDVFTQHSPALIALAYQMLGELSSAEDLVQEAWIKWHTTDQHKIKAPYAWLKTVRRADWL